MSTTDAPRGLATLALLKHHYDSGRDHIDMFVPFVRDGALHLKQDDFDIVELKAEIVSRHRLDIPLPTLRVLLTRLKRRGEIRLEGGRYFRKLLALQGADLTESRSKTQENQALLATELVNFARGQKVTLTETDALSYILDFLELHHLHFLIGEELPKAEQYKEARLIARFFEDVCLKEPKLTASFQEMVEGFVLQNALLLRDISAADRKFTDLEVIFDSGFLFKVLGYEGSTQKLATTELLTILRETGAGRSVLEVTLEEVKRILAIYERKLVTVESREQLFPTPLTRYFLTHHYRPSDVAQAISLLEENVRHLGIRIIKTPARDREFTLNERALALKLKRPHESELEPRVVHDVDCIATILMLRRGLRPAGLDNARAAFMTTNSEVVQTVTAWFREEGEKGLPPIVHYLYLSNYAWVKKPAAAVALKLHELVALCSSALRPSQQTWDRFLRVLREMRSRGEISSDETVAVIANRLTERVLVDLEDAEQVDASSIEEAIDRLKASYAEDAAARIAEIEAHADEVLAQKSADAERRIQSVETEMAETKEREEVIRERIERLARILSGVFSGAIFYGGGAVIAIALLLGLPFLLGRFGFWWQVAAYVAGIMIALLTWFNLVAGVHLKALRRRLRVALKLRILRYFL